MGFHPVWVPLAAAVALATGPYPSLPCASLSWVPLHLGPGKCIRPKPEHYRLALTSQGTQNTSHLAGLFGSALLTSQRASPGQIYSHLP